MSETNQQPEARETVVHAAVERMRRKHATMDALILGLFCLPLLPFVQNNAFAVGWALCSAMVGMSMNVLAGYAGQISLAQAALFGTGAFTIGVVTSNLGVPWLLAVPLAALFTALITLVIGFPALRVKGLNLAILTLGFQFAMQRVLFRVFGASGVEVHRPEIFGVKLIEDRYLLFLIIAALVGLFLLDRNLTRSRMGRAFLALRQDELVASSFGINIANYKLLAFAMSGFYAGIAGAMFGTLQQDVTNESFEFIFSIEFLVFAVLGGLGSRVGTAVGGAFPVLYRQFLQYLRTAGAMLGGILLLYTLLRLPGGLAAEGRELKHGFQIFTSKGPRGVFAFFTVVASAIGLFFVVPIILGPVADLIAPAISQSTDTPEMLRFLLGLAGLAGGLRGGLLIAAKMIGLTPAAVTVVEAPADDDDEVDAPVRQIKAPSIDLKRRSDGVHSSGPLLEIVGVTKQFGGVRALDDVSMVVERGELIGIMGPNGSGKTTMLNNISGFIDPTKGDILYEGRSIIGLRADQRAALGIGRTFQNIGLVKSETVSDNLIISQHLVADYPAMTGLLRTPTVTSEERRLRMRAAAVVEMLGLEDIVDERIHSLPHGLAKLVELGAALVTGPELLLLDEPAAGVSPREADALGETLQQVAKHFGVTIVMIEHHVPLMLSTCDYIYVLNFGRLLTHGLPMDVARHPDVIAAYLGGVGEEASLAVAGG
ncbi:MAG: ABC transporter permease subunit [Actinomycetota bacterium]